MDNSPTSGSLHAGFCRPIQRYVAPLPCSVNCLKGSKWPLYAYRRCFFIEHGQPFLAGGFKCEKKSGRPDWMQPEDCFRQPGSPGRAALDPWFCVVAFRRLCLFVQTSRFHYFTMITDRCQEKYPICLGYWLSTLPAGCRRNNTVFDRDTVHRRTGRVNTVSRCLSWFTTGCRAADVRTKRCPV